MLSHSAIRYEVHLIQIQYQQAHLSTDLKSLQSDQPEIKLTLYFDFQLSHSCLLPPLFLHMASNFKRGREVLYMRYPTTLIIKANLERFPKTGETNKLENNNMGRENMELLFSFSFLKHQA